MKAAIGITINELARNVPSALIAACERMAVSWRPIHLNTLVTLMSPDLSVHNETGRIDVDYLSPSLLYWQDQAVFALRVLEEVAGTRTLNSVDATLTADDKAATALALTRAGIPQVPTTLVGLDLERLRQAAAYYGFPVVVKRTHGAQGRWVRLATNSTELAGAFSELQSEGPGALLVQPVGSVHLGESVRVIVTGGIARAWTVRHAGGDEWRSNISIGGSQGPTNLTAEEKAMATQAARALGLGHAGIDLLRSASGSAVLEVNSCPDFTSMIPYVDVDMAAVVIEETLSLLS